MSSNGKEFDFETVAVIIFSLLEVGHTLGPKHFQMMADVHGTRTQYSFEHQFRKVKARAKEMQEDIKNGTFKTKLSGAPRAEATKKCGVKRGRKTVPKTGTSTIEEDEEDVKVNKPLKKIKTEESHDSDENFPHFEL